MPVAPVQRYVPSKPPVVAPGHTPASVTDKIASVVLAGTLIIGLFLTYVFRLALSPGDVGRIIAAAGGQIEKVKQTGETPIALCSPTIRSQFTPSGLDWSP